MISWIDDAVVNLHENTRQKRKQDRIVSHPFNRAKVYPRQHVQTSASNLQLHCLQLLSAAMSHDENICSVQLLSMHAQQCEQRRAQSL
eukprot:2722875-Amphidinium_carterae.1